MRCTTVEQLPQPPTEATYEQLTDTTNGLLASIKAKGARGDRLLFMLTFSLPGSQRGPWQRRQCGPCPLHAAWWWGAGPASAWGLAGSLGAFEAGAAAAGSAAHEPDNPLRC